MASQDRMYAAGYSSVTSTEREKEEATTTDDDEEDDSHLPSLHYVQHNGNDYSTSDESDLSQVYSGNNQYDVYGAPFTRHQHPAAVFEEIQSMEGRGIRPKSRRINPNPRGLM